MSLTGIEAGSVDLMQPESGELLRDKRSILEALNAHSIVFEHLQALKQEEASLDAEGFTLRCYLIYSFLYLLEDVPDALPLERCHSCQQLVKDAAKGPSVYFLIVALPHQHLR